MKIDVATNLFHATQAMILDVTKVKQTQDKLLGRKPFTQNIQYKIVTFLPPKKGRYTIHKPINKHEIYRLRSLPLCIKQITKIINHSFSNHHNITLYYIYNENNHFTKQPQKLFTYFWTNSLQLDFLFL